MAQDSSPNSVVSKVHHDGDVEKSSVPGGNDMAPARTLRVALISNVPPQACGIATFAGDIIDTTAHYTPQVELDNYPLADQADDNRHTIVRDEPSSYKAAAARINRGAYDAVWVQHEYGIFGGPSGEMVCDFVNQLRAPLVLTLHTILEEPSEQQERILRHLVDRASRIMVMSEHGRNLLASRYGAPHRIIDVIEHGAPDRPFNRTAEMKSRLGLTGRKVLMTFGLLGPGKGLENAISALPAIAEKEPSVLYRIVGATHPKLVEREGEAYRERLMAQAEELGVADKIEWVNRFLDTDELLDNLEACDIYLTPYHNLQQATSGTLSYAVALGKAVVSTPYVHARELLADNVGCLVEPNDPEGIARVVTNLLSSEQTLFALQHHAYLRGRRTIWPEFARNTAAFLDAAVPEGRTARRPNRVRLTAVQQMSDNVGIYQHSRFVVADRSHGYCLDDNARALMLANSLAQLGDDRLDQMRLVYAAFVQDAWDSDLGRFRNFMSFSRQWLESDGSDDSNGRGFWALGQTIAKANDTQMQEWATALYDNVLPHVRQMESPRAMAFSMLGAAERLSVQPGHEASLVLLREGAKTLSWLLEQSRRPDWRWFEAMLGYDNPRLAQALLAAGQHLHEPHFVDIGLETLRWITKRQTSAKGHFAPVGSDSFGRDYEQLPFDQQPLEAQAHIEACYTASLLDPDGDWASKAKLAWDWFFGRNDRNVVMIDEATGRCFDGITPRGRNKNSGAESLLAFLLAQCAMLNLTVKQGSERTRGNKSTANNAPA